MTPHRNWPTGWRTGLHFVATWVLCGHVTGAMAQTPAMDIPFREPPKSDKPDRCVAAAAEYHQVNVAILTAVLRVESGMRPDAVSKNSNGSVDVGMGQMNSIHFGELARYGVKPEDLLDPCVATYVAAWHLRRTQERHGNTWEGVASYHSATPAYNWRYRVMLHNELIRMGVIQGAKVQPVPSLSSLSSVPKKAPPPATQANEAAAPAMPAAPAQTRQRAYGKNYGATAAQAAPAIR